MVARISITDDYLFKLNILRNVIGKIKRLPDLDKVFKITL